MIIKIKLITVMKAEVTMLEEALLLIWRID